MYEEITYEDILQRMLDQVPDKIDRREGSVIYDAIAPAAIELKLMYIELDNVLNEVFADTASREFLIKRAAEFGIFPNPASRAVLKGKFTPKLELVAGQKFASVSRSLTYVAKEKIGEGLYSMECELAGAEGNKYFGDIIPIDYVEGLETAELTELLTVGIEEESTEHFRDTFLFHIRNPITSGNINHYKLWALEVEGIGNAKAVEAWNGKGTVKVIVTDEEQKPAGSVLLESVRKHIEEVRPVGAEVTVVAATAKVIDISVCVEITQGSYLEEIKVAFMQELKKYLMSTAFSKKYISIATIGGILLKVGDVIDYTGLTLNRAGINVPMGDCEVAVLGIVEVKI